MLHSHWTHLTIWTAGQEALVTVRDALHYLRTYFSKGFWQALWPQADTEHPGQHCLCWDLLSELNCLVLVCYLQWAVAEERLFPNLLAPRTQLLPGELPTLTEREKRKVSTNFSPITWCASCLHSESNLTSYPSVSSCLTPPGKGSCGKRISSV